MILPAQHRHFLFLQGPHGPFFCELGKSLIAAGHQVSRVGFNRGDQQFWPDLSTYIAFTEPMPRWPERIHALLENVTDLVVYGDTRRQHATAIEIAKSLGITVHCFEEGYLRPYWITYERGGNNGNSDLMAMGLREMEAVLEASPLQLTPAPAQWGPMWHHTWAGCRYHFNILMRNKDYPNYVSHRSESVRRELRLHIKRLANYPLDSMRRRLRTRQLLNSGAPYHLVLLQLSHDAAVQDHSDFSSMLEFTEYCIAEFAKSAPKHHMLVLKAHPLEDCREPIEAHALKIAAERGIAGRVAYIQGGKLGPLLDRARSTVTVNSTAGQQALWRGLPLKSFGRGVYCRPELTSSQSLQAFFAQPDAPDRAAYGIFRQFLLETSQISGGFYTRTGRANARRQVIDRMLAPADPYTMRMKSGSAHLKIVSARR